MRMATVMMLALVAVELTDVVFALDSIPAVLSITRQPFLAYTSNIMAVMGLRSLYVLLAAGLAKLRYLHFGLAVVLGFAAVKMLLADWVVIGPVVSLGVIAGLMAVTVGVSVVAGRRGVVLSCQFSVLSSQFSGDGDLDWVGKFRIVARNECWSDTSNGMRTLRTDN